jgi:hypothetical protein
MFQSNFAGSDVPRYIRPRLWSEAMADQGYADGANRSFPAGNNAPNRSLFLSLAISAVSFAAGGGAFALMKPTPWDWSSPLSLTFVALAVFCAGVAAMSFALSKSRDAATQAAAQEVDQTRRYAALLREKAELLDRNGSDISRTRS